MKERSMYTSTKLVIWDYDGVLIDSENIANNVFAKCLQEHGVNISVEQCFELLIGRSSEAIYSKITEITGVNFTKDEIYRIQKNIENELTMKVSAIQDAHKVLQLLKNNLINYCIASGSSITRIKKTLVTAGLSDFFQSSIIFSATMVEKGKPEPDLFLHAAKSMNIHPNNCLVIEDSAAGIQAAKAAKMKCIAFIGGSHSRGLWYRKHILKQKPDMVLRRMNDVENFIKKILSTQH